MHPARLQHCGPEQPFYTGRHNGHVPPPNTPPSEASPPEDSAPSDDDIEIDPIPCKGDLCYDPEDPNVQARKADYREWLATTLCPPEDQSQSSDGDDGFSYDAERCKDEVIAVRETIISSCNYYRDDRGRVRVECLKNLGSYYVCPHMWYKPGMLLIGGIQFKTDEPHICHQDWKPVEGTVCNPYGCNTGQVCSGHFKRAPEDNLEDFYLNLLPVCMDVDTCLRIREADHLPAAETCFYQDLTTVNTGEIELYGDCNTLDKGLCSTDCGCQNTNEACLFVSEKHPIGICSPTTCTPTNPGFSCKNGYECAYIDWSPYQRQSGATALYRWWFHGIPDTYGFTALSGPKWRWCVPAGACASYDGHVDSPYLFVQCP